MWQIVTKAAILKWGPNSSFLSNVVQGTAILAKYNTSNLGSQGHIKVKAIPGEFKK